MTVLLGITKRAAPLEAATAHPVDPVGLLTVNGAFESLYSSMNSSLAPLGPRTRNSLMFRASAMVGEQRQAPITTPALMKARMAFVPKSCWRTGGGPLSGALTFNPLRSRRQKSSLGVGHASGGASQ